MLSKVTLANGEGTDIVLHEDTQASKRFLVSAQGLAGVGGLRSSKRVRPSAHGSLNETSFEEGRSVHLAGEVWATTGPEKALEEFRAVAKPMLETLDQGAALLKWTEASAGLKLQMAVKLDAELEPILQEGMGFVQWATSFFAADPRAYSQTLTTQVGATITGSAEQEFVKTTATFAGLAIDGSHIYWAGKEAIGRSTLAGGTVEPEWVKTGAGATPESIAVNGSNVFWVSGLGIGRCTLAGGTIEKEWLKRASISNGTVAALAIDASHIYWTNHEVEPTGKGSIGRATLAGGTIEKTWIPSGSAGAGPEGIAVDASHIYWCAGTSVARAELSGASIELEWITGSSPQDVVVSATNVYWTNGSGNTIGRAKIGGTEVTQSLVSGAHHPYALAINASNIFWNNWTTGYIGRVAIAGGPSGSTLTVAQAGNRPTPLTFKINGPITDPAVVRESDGSRIALTGTISSGNYVEINTAERTVKLNGTTNLLSFLNAQNTNWAAFAPLASTKFFLIGTSAAAASLEILYRSAYA